MFHAPLGDGRYYQAEVTNKHLASWKMRKSVFIILTDIAGIHGEQIYPLCEKIENVLEGISCCLNNGEAEDSLGYVVTGPGGAASVLYWDTLQELSRLMPDSFIFCHIQRGRLISCLILWEHWHQHFPLKMSTRMGTVRFDTAWLGNAISSHGFHYSPSENKNKLLTIREWLKV